MMYEKRQKEAAARLGELDTAMALITADADVRYLTGMPYGSLLFLFPSGKSILLPWDELLAHQLATAGEIIPYTDYGRNLERALKSIVKRKDLGSGASIEVPSDTGHLRLGRLREVLSGFTILCRNEGVSSYLQRRRMVKDEEELGILRKACALTDELIDEIEDGVKSGALRTEAEVALHLEGAALAGGAEAMGFQTLAAGPDRSFGIHAFPARTASPFGTTGLSILDFGVNVAGYSSDVTLTVVRGRTELRQEMMISLVQEAYETASSMACPGTGTSSIAEAVDEVFAREGYAMPHSLGHGIGLEVHEAPLLRSAAEADVTLEPGMVFTIEPGLYHAEAGGVRLENDFLITATGHEVLTNSRLLRLP